MPSIIEDNNNILPSNSSQRIQDVNRKLSNDLGQTQNLMSERRSLRASKSIELQPQTSFQSGLVKKALESVKANAVKEVVPKRRESIKTTVSVGVDRKQPIKANSDIQEVVQQTKKENPIAPSIFQVAGLPSASQLKKQQDAVQENKLNSQQPAPAVPAPVVNRLGRKFMLRPNKNIIIAPENQTGETGVNNINNDVQIDAVPNEVIYSQNINFRLQGIQRLSKEIPL